MGFGLPRPRRERRLLPHLGTVREGESFPGTFPGLRTSYAGPLGAPRPFMGA